MHSHVHLGVSLLKVAPRQYLRRPQVHRLRDVYSCCHVVHICCLRVVLRRDNCHCLIGFDARICKGYGLQALSQLVNTQDFTSNKGSFERQRLPVGYRAAKRTKKGLT